MNDLLIAALAVGFGQVVKGITGFGAALVAMPVLVMLYGPRDAVAVMVGVDTLAGLSLMPAARKQIVWTVVLAVFLPLLVGQTFGTTMLISLPERPIALALGVLVTILGSALVYRPVTTGWGELEQVPQGRSEIYGFGAVAGVFGGVLQALVGAAGPPIVVWTRRYFTDAFGRAQLIAVFWLGAAALWMQLTIRNGGLGESAVRIAACLPTLLGGAMLGQYLSDKLPRESFGRMVGLLLVGAGLVLFAS